MGLRSLCQYKAECTIGAQPWESRAEAPAPGHGRSLGTRTYPRRDPPPPRSPQNLQHSLVMSNPSHVFLQISKFPIHQCQRLCLSKDFLRASQLQRRFNIKDQKPLTNSSMWPSAIPHGLQKNQARAITGSAHRNKPEVSHHCARVHLAWTLSVNAGGEGFSSPEKSWVVYILPK